MNVIMKKSKFTWSQIIKALKENEQGRSVGDISRELGIDKSTFYLYLVETTVQAGVFYVAAHLDPLSMKNERQFARIQKRIAKSKIRTFNKAELQEKTKDYENIIRKASREYYTKKKKGKEIPILNEPIDENLLFEFSK